MNVLKIYNDTYWSLLNLNDTLYLKKHNKIKNTPGFFTTPEERDRVSLSRTKRNIKEICLCNDFKYFFTCTVNSKMCDRFHLQEVQDKMKKICKKIKRKNNEFKYIFITEKHENGAFHFHGMAKNLELYKNEYGYLSSKDFDELGYNSFSIIQDFNKCCNYITKYITKKCVKNENNQIYFCSRGLKRPKDEFMINYDLTEIFDKVFENDYIQKKDFDLTKLSEKQKLKLNDYFRLNDDYFENNKYITNWLQLFTKFYKNDNIHIS